MLTFCSNEQFIFGHRQGESKDEKIMYSINIYCLITFINYQVICLQEEAVAYIAIISGLMLLCQRKAILIESIS